MIDLTAYEFYVESADDDNVDEIVVSLRKIGDEYLNPDGEDEAARQISRSGDCGFSLKPDEDVPSAYFVTPKAGRPLPDLESVSETLTDLGLTENSEMFS